MSSIVINPKNPKELQLLKDMLNKMGVKSRVLSDDETEDLGLTLLMKEVDRSDVVSEDEVMNKLQSR